MRILNLSLAILALMAAAPLSAKPAGLTVRAGESWAFSLFRGQPVNARKVRAGAQPGPGQIHVTVRTLMGTTMSISSANDIAYTYQAELIGVDRPVTVRSCTLPANGRVSFEHWPEIADAVRLSNFKPAPKGGACP